MSIRNLDKLFAPKSICLLGDFSKKENLARNVLKNIVQAEFDGVVMPVSKTVKSIFGLMTYPSLAEVPIAPDLVMLCDQYGADAKLIAEIGEMGCKAVMLFGPSDPLCSQLSQELEELSQKYQMRILGPNSLGAVIPSKNLNMSSFHLPIKHGKIAYVSQSGAMCSTVIDWANAHDIGFSHFISLGNCGGVGFGDVLDYLGSDPFTRAILVSFESIAERRNFMSAARAAARNKPILVLKTGKYEKSSYIAQSHTGAMAGSDLVYEAAFRRAGMLRVNSIAELFASAETLSMTKPFKGKRLGIISNGGGLNILAVDHLLDLNGELVELSEETQSKLQAVLKNNHQISNPIDLGASASPKLYGEVYEILKKSREVDCVLYMHAPNGSVNGSECAKAVIEKYNKRSDHLISCWVGEQTVSEARKLFEKSEIPTYSSPRMAIMAFMHIVEYAKSQVMLMETPERVPAEIKPARKVVKDIISKALAAGDQWLKEPDVKEILKAYGIDIVRSHVAKDAAEAVKIADKIGYPVVVKILSKDLVHKSDVGGVVLSLHDAQAVESAVAGIIHRMDLHNPHAEIEGFILQKMVDRQNAHELIAGMTHDPVFGPVIMFGSGGTATEVVNDRAIALPPINMGLAKDLVSRTRIQKLLEGYRDQAGVDMNALCQVLIELSEICIDFPEIQEFDINPILSSPTGALAVDARIRVQACNEKFPNRRLAIRPYPQELEEEFLLRNGRKTIIRPIKPEDEPAHEEFMKHITPEDIRFRFFGSVRGLPHSEMARLTQLDYDREMAFVAQAPNEEDGHMETLGVVRTGTDSDNEDAEYAILVRSDLKGQKLGWKLLNKMIEYCRSRGTTYFTGQILRENRTMIEMVRAMGFEVKTIIEEDIVEVRLKL